MKKNIDKFDVKKNKYMFLERNYLSFKALYADLKIAMKKKDKSLVTFILCLYEDSETEIIKKYEENYKSTFKEKNLKSIKLLNKKFDYFIEEKEKIKRSIHNLFYDENNKLKIEIDLVVKDMFKVYNKAFEEKTNINDVLRENTVNENLNLK